ncbi:MAG: hypothetical protein ACYC6B_09205 [Thermoleophilia bacterium]
MALIFALAAAEIVFSIRVFRLPFSRRDEIQNRIVGFLFKKIVLMKGDGGERLSSLTPPRLLPSKTTVWYSYNPGFIIRGRVRIYSGESENIKEVE